MRVKKKREVNVEELMVRMKPFAAGAVVLLVAAGMYFAWRGLERVMFSHNPAFNITEVIVPDTSLAVRADVVKRDTGIMENVNIFSFDAAKVSRDFLNNYPSVANLRIKKTLPSTVEITIEDREPALRVGQSMIIISRDGLVMVADEAMQRRWGGVPILTNGSEPIKLEAGGRVKDGKIALALEIANTHNADGGLFFKIGKIDIGNGVYAVMEISDSRVPRIVRFPWDDINTGGSAIHKAMSATKKAFADPRTANEARLTVLISTNPPKVIGSPTWD